MDTGHKDGLTMDWFREHLTRRLDRLFVVIGALCLPLALALSRVKSYTMIDPFGREVQTRAHPRYGSFFKVLLTLLLVVGAVRGMICAVSWVVRGSRRR
jgi:hypothetical protein